ncbi:MAG: alpha/beta fold hydrolase [Geodermatophilaceae bacterium]|nr:alpha/beta fold hydrolase [Geodermatophilaceae bacterium]MDQ3477208.1 alpha/beta fold hydrolase [Actinomycetota bacterium]
MPVLAGAEPFTFDGGRVGILLIHGFTGTPQSLRPWGEHLAAQGYSISCPRLPGHGTVLADMNATRWPDWYAAVERALEELRGRCTEVFAAGLSMGGTLALRLAEQHGERLSGLVLVNPSLATERKDLALLKILAKGLPSWKGVSNDIKKPGAREVAYPRIPLKAAVSLQDLWATTRAELAKIDVPILTFRSTEDHVVEPLSGRLLLDGVRSTDVTEQLLHDSYHVATLDNDAEQIFARSAAWIADHVGKRKIS